MHTQHNLLSPIPCAQHHLIQYIIICTRVPSMYI